MHMTTRVEKSVMVNVPVSRAYNQWTQFEDFPRFMGGVQSVTQLSDDRLQWVAEIAGVKRQWEARILEQVPDQKVAWAATEGATNAGAVTFEDLGGDQTSVTLVLEYEPEGVVEKVGDKLNIVENQAENDLERFKQFIESEGYATGAWRGSVDSGAPVGTPGVEDAQASQGDSGKAGPSGKAVAAGLGVAAAATAAAVAGRSGSTETQSEEVVEVVDVDTTPATPVTPVATSGEGQSVAGSDEGQDLRMLTDEEIEAGASDVPLGADEQGKPDLGTAR
jgi:carbon monoxide dehydrogenase subunit G